MGKDPNLLTEVSSKFTEDTLKSILTKVYRTNAVQVLGWEFEPGSSKGDNYLSIVYRATIDGVVDGISEQIKVVIKGLPKNEATRKTFRSAEFFGNEYYFYTKVIPELEKFLQLKGQKEILAVPKCLGAHSDGENDFIVLEDIRVLGYGHSPRQEVLDIKDIQVIFNALARFHAVSFAYKDQQPSKFAKAMENLRETYYSENHWSWYEKLFTSAYNAGKDAMQREYKDTPEEIKFSSLTPWELYEKTIPFGHFQSDPTTILTQGDSWPANFMVRGGDNPAEKEAILLDFQLARCASPVLDLSNFIYTSTNKEMRDKDYDNLLKYYHGELSKYITLLGSDPRKIYPWNLFMKEVKERSICGFCFSLEGLPVMMLEEDEAFETENIVGNESVNVAEIIQIKPVENPEKRRRLADMIVHAIQHEFI